jgi:hypothetical protein
MIQDNYSHRMLITHLVVATLLVISAIGLWYVEGTYSHLLSHGLLFVNSLLLALSHWDQIKTTQKEHHKYSEWRNDVDEFLDKL